MNTHTRLISLVVVGLLAVAVGCKESPTVTDTVRGFDGQDIQITAPARHIKEYQESVANLEKARDRIQRLYPEYEQACAQGDVAAEVRLAKELKSACYKITFLWKRADMIRHARWGNIPFEPVKAIYLDYDRFAGKTEARIADSLAKPVPADEPVAPARWGA